MSLTIVRPIALILQLLLKSVKKLKDKSPWGQFNRRPPKSIATARETSLNTKTNSVLTIFAFGLVVGCVCGMFGYIAYVIIRQSY